MRLRIQAFSVCGPVRDENQDMVLVGEQLVRNGEHSIECEVADRASPLLVAVADGMGGHRGGALASELVCCEMSKAVGSLPVAEDQTKLRDCLVAELTTCHKLLLHRGKSIPDLHGMGTTFTGMAIGLHCAASIHAGDSRLYRLRDDILVRLTTDHTLRELTGNTQFSANLIANAVGGGQSFYAECEDLTHRLLPGDTYLICTDGLTGHVPDHQIMAALAEGQPSTLLEAAIEVDGSDNVSLVVVQVVSVSEAPVLNARSAHETCPNSWSH